MNKKFNKTSCISVPALPSVVCPLSSAPLRLAHLESSMDWGGQELRIVEQCAWLNAHGHRAWIIANPRAAIVSHAQAQHVPIAEIPMYGVTHPYTLLRLIRFIHENDINVIDCHSQRASYYGAYLKWLTAKAVIRSHHVANPIHANNLKQLFWRHGSHGIVVTATMIREQLIAQNLTAGQPIHLALPGVDPERFHPQIEGQALRAQWGIPADATLIANIGMIRPDKGQLYFVEACRSLMARHHKLYAVQLGEATCQTAAYKEAVLASAQAEIATGKIQFLGYQGEIEQWLAMADIVVIASTVEAQTRLVTQAFLMKKNVVATTVGGLPEMITPLRTGLLCQPGQAAALAATIEQLINNPSLAHQLKENAYQQAMTHWTFNAMMQEMLSYYRQALEQSKKHAKAS